MGKYTETSEDSPWSVPPKAPGLAPTTAIQEIYFSSQQQPQKPTNKLLKQLGSDIVKSMFDQKYTFPHSSSQQKLTKKQLGIKAETVRISLVSPLTPFWNQKYVLQLI